MEEADALFFDSDAAFEAWLEKNWDKEHELWVKIAKKASGIPSLDQGEAVDICLCFGWIDGKVKGLDETYYLQRYTPRRPRSVWSKVNVKKIAALTAAGRMRPSGMAQVESAKADGRWAAAYDGAATATVPDDLAAALKKARLTDTFEGLSSSNRYAILHALMTAKKPETRERRMKKYLDMLAEGKRPND